MTAYARLVLPGPRALTICPRCDVTADYPHESTARVAARDHNRREHPRPTGDEQP